MQLRGLRSGSATTTPRTYCHSRLAALIESGEAPFEALIVRNSKRLGRWDDPGMHDYLRIHFQMRGVRMLLVEGPNPDFSRGMTPEAMVQSMWARMDNISGSQERTETRRRIMTGVRRRVCEGYYPGTTAPYGTERWLANKYRGHLVERVPDGLRIRKQDCAYKLVWGEEQRLEAIRLIFQWMEEEECSLEEIARRLNEKGYPPPRRPTTRKQSRRERQISGWTASAVRYILQNPLYVGDLIWGKFRKDEDPVPHTEADLNCEGAVLHRDFMPDPPVTRERFENVQRILERQRQKRRSGKQEVPYVLSGLITCVHCGAGWYGFTSTRAERTRRRYYRHEQGNRTSASRGETLCPHRNRYVRASEIERLVLHQALTAAQSDSLEERIRDEIRSRLKMLRSTDHAARAQRLETQLARHEEEVARVILEKARTTDATLLKGYDRVLEELSRGVRETELRLSELKEEHRNAERALDCYAESLSQARDLLSVFEVAPLSQKRAVLKELIEAIGFDPEQCRAEVRILLPAP